MTETAHASGWQAGRLLRIVPRTRTVKSFFLKLSRPFVHRPGQHVDVRLTAPDGYIAMRSYSIASSPNASGIIELAIERLDGGEVSPFLHDIALVDDEIEIRGPLGGHFVWPECHPSSALLVGAGSGVAPLMAMVRYWSAALSGTQVALLLSARHWDDIIFREELVEFARAPSGLLLSIALTREASRRSTDFSRRVDTAMVQEVISRLDSSPEAVFVCGSNGFVNAATDGVVAAQIPGGQIKTERYGV